MGRKKEPEKAPNHERWLVSYADFITLLFAFFVVMFASSNTDVTKQEQMEKSMREAFSGLGLSPFISTQPTMAINTGSPTGTQQISINITPDNNSTLGPVVPNPDRGGDGPDNTGQAPDFNPLPNVPNEFGPGASQTEPTPTPAPAAGEHPSEGSPAMKQIFNDLKNVLQDEITNGKVNLREEKRGVVISLSEAGFFDSGSARLKPVSLQTIDQIARKLLAINKKDVAIRIEGHTDNVPLSGRREFRDNLDLSTARANSVIYRLIEAHKFPPQRLIASGYGEWRPIAPNATEEGRGRNRRVDIVILNDEYSHLEATQH